MSDHETHGGDKIRVEDAAALDVVKSGISQRAAELRTDAINEIKDIRGELELAQKQVAEYRASLVEAVQVAATVGVSKEQLAQYAGFSASTIGNWIRGEKEDEG
jgi:DNA-binding transcriptional regulator YiaG